MTKVRPLFTLSHRGSPLCDSVNRGLTLVILGFFIDVFKQFHSYIKLNMKQDLTSSMAFIYFFQSTSSLCLTLYTHYITTL